MMMLALLAGPYENTNQAADDSAGVLLLDLKKAYHTVDKNYMLLVLQ